MLPTQKLVIPALGLMLGIGCGGTTGTNTDIGASPDLTMAAGADLTMAAGDMALPTLFKLQSGTYVVDTLTIGIDGCTVNPNDPMNPTIGKTFTLTNDGMGNIGLGTVGGTPMQPSNGASCPGMPVNPACATALKQPPAPFNNNTGVLVRDNDITDGAMPTPCTEHRHVENVLTLTADNTFGANYLRTDTKHMNCTQMADCTTTWMWTMHKQ